MRTTLSTRSATVHLEIPAHCRAAYERRGNAWLVSQLEAAAAEDMGHTLERYLAAKQEESQMALKTSMESTGGNLYTARLYDGNKIISEATEPMTIAQAEKWLSGQVKDYRAAQERLAQHEGM